MLTLCNFCIFFVFFKISEYRSQISLNSFVIFSTLPRLQMYKTKDINGEQKYDVTLPWYQNFWITTIGNLTKDDGDGNENGKIQQVQISKNNNVARASRFFVRFLAVVARLRHETSNFTRPLYGVDEHKLKLSFSFC